MTPHIDPLSSEEQQQAHQLWDDLMFAPTRAAFDLARDHLSAASAPVRNAIIWESIALKTHENPPKRGENPFSKAR